jgi:hypothetical protein
VTPARLLIAEGKAMTLAEISSTPTAKRSIRRAMVYRSLKGGRIRGL